MEWDATSLGKIGIGILLCGCAVAVTGFNSYKRTDFSDRSLSVRDMETLGIKDVITKVQDELRESETDRIGSNKSSLFQVKDFDLEIKFVIGTKTSDSQQAGLQLVTLDTKAEYSQEKVHQIKLHMVVPERKPTILPPSGAIALPKEGAKTLGPVPKSLEDK